jgi:hypothetical protein
MSVAFELEYHSFHPQLHLVPDRPWRAAPPAPFRRRRLVLGLVVGLLLVLLMLPIHALGGKTLAADAPAPGQEYVVRGGDTLASIARQADRADVAGMTRRLAAEVGSSVVVPGEHLRIP